MVDFRVKEKVDTALSENAYIPTGALVMKAAAPAALSNYDTDIKCIQSGLIPCDGRTLNAATYTVYQRLFDIIENIYGVVGVITVFFIFTVFGYNKGIFFG